MKARSTWCTFARAVVSHDTQTQTQTQTCQPLGEAAKKRRDMLGQCRTHRQRASESLSAGSGDDVVR